jgi:sterol-4alpha-carboxylate 3-dehydrogenase (decarboxylating)
MESYLVTGGCGLQGSSIVAKLLAAHPGAAIAVMARNPDLNRLPGVTYHRGDITVSEDIARVLAAARPTVVFHCAGVMTIGKKPMPDAVVRAINDGGTRLMVEAAGRAGVKAFVYTSSASVVQVDTWKDVIDGDESLPTCTYDDESAMIYPKAKVGHSRCLRDSSELFALEQIDALPIDTTRLFNSKLLTRAPRPKASVLPSLPTLPAPCAPAPSVRQPSTASATTTSPRA